MKHAIALTLTTALVALATTAPFSIVAAERIGKVSQPIIVGDLVSTKRQRALGLVIVGGGCSGTLLNRYWVLTADHCVTSDGMIGGPDAPFKDSRITANWTNKAATPTRYVRYANRGLDVALIFLGAGDLGHADRKLIYHNQVDDSMILTKFGQGYCGYASGSGDDATPAEDDCGYRSATYTPSEASDTAIQYRPNASGQIASFGDSGGPDWVSDGHGNLLSIAGVTSTGRTRFLPGKPQDSEWVSDERSGTSAALLTIRDDIHRHMAEAPPLVVATRPREYGDIIVSRDTGVRTKGPSAYKDAMIDPNVPAVPAAPALPYGPATCRSGFVWRVAASQDLVCVTPDARERVADENSTAALRWRGGADGSHRCKRGYVHREAYAGDDVCVTRESYDLAQEENAQGPSRRVQP